MNTEQIKSLITSEATAAGVDPQLALAVARAESSFDPNARSRVGAMGLFQLMPKTAAAYGVSNAFDPIENTRAGVRMLADLDRQYRGDLPSILAAYNWGSGNLASGRPLPAETSDYIARIFSFLGVPGSSSGEVAAAGFDSGPAAAEDWYAVDAGEAPADDAGELPAWVPVAALGVGLLAAVYLV